MCVASILFIVMMFVVIEQNNELKEKLEVEIAQLEEKVAAHEEVIRQYEFYVWHNMKFFEDKE